MAYKIIRTPNHSVVLVADDTAALDIGDADTTSQVARERRLYAELSRRGLWPTRKQGETSPGAVS